MPGVSNYRIVESSGSGRRLQLVIGASRVTLHGLRPQAEEVIRYMIRRNAANGSSPIVCTYGELQRAVWGDRQISNEKGQLARLVFEIRQALAPILGNDDLIQSVPGRGYVLDGNSSATQSTSHPFVCGPPIAHPAGFFGRENELRRIFSLWKHSPLQHIALTGARRSGKTSLLHYLAAIHNTPPDELRPGQVHHMLEDTRGCRAVFIDCQDARLRTPEAMVEYILAQLGMATPLPCSLATLVDLLSNASQRTILMFDELEVALNNTQFDAVFWAGLRSLATTRTGGLLGYVIAMRAEPPETAFAAGNQSPFLNIFGHSLALGPFTRKEALELVHSSPRPFPEADVDWLLSESRLLPSFLQMLCDTRLTALEEDQTEEQWKQEGLRRIQRFRSLLNCR